MSLFQIFTPSVSATCRAGVMTIKVETGGRFLGVVHARDYRSPWRHQHPSFLKFTSQLST